jgi:hypothetical protein
MSKDRHQYPVIRGDTRYTARVRRKSPSRADQALLAELRRRACEVSFTQIERWRYWRGTGLVSRTIQHGQGRGSTSEHPSLDSAASQIEEVAQLRRRYRSLDEIAVVLASRGRALDPVSVKAALAAVLEAIERSFRRHEPVSNDPIVVAANAARALTRALYRSTERGSEPASPTSRRSIAVGARALVGLPLSDKEITEFVELSGVGPIARILGASDELLVTAMKSALSLFSFARMRAALANADPPSVVLALKDAGTVIRGVPLALFPSETARDVAIVGAAVVLLAQGKPR